MNVNIWHRIQGTLKHVKLLHREFHFNAKNHGTFVRRCTGSANNIRLGYPNLGRTASVRLLSTDTSGDGSTGTMEKTLGMIKPEVYPKIGELMDQVYEHGFHLSNLKMCLLNREDCIEFYAEHKGKKFFDDLVDYITSGPVIAMELTAENAIKGWRKTLGPTDSNQARREVPMSIRARFGENQYHNACHGSDSPISSAREIEFFFPKKGPGKKCTSIMTEGSTCCVIKPHAVVIGQAGNIISHILLAGFEISAMELFYMKKENAESFLYKYKDTVEEYPRMVQELASGPCIAIEVRGEKGIAPVAFKEMVGPDDPEVARKTEPETLRAKFGKDTIQNAVHCTVHPEDALPEVEYFFKILDPSERKKL